MIPRKEIEAYLAPLSPLPTGLVPSGRFKRPVRAVLFDVYGTLLISGSGDIGTARKTTVKAEFADLLRRHAISRSPDAVSDSFFAGIEAVHARRRAEGVDHPEVEVDRIWMTVLGIQDRRQAQRFAVEYELIVNPVYPMPGILRTLEQCRARGLAMGIVSNAQFFTPWLFSWFFDQSPEELGFAEHLQIFSYRLGCAKPSRMLFDNAIEGLAEENIAPGDAVFVGNDMVNDVAAAQKAGFQTALFAGDARSLRLRKEDPRIRGVKPDLVVTELMQIPELLEHQESGARSQNKSAKTVDSRIL